MNEFIQKNYTLLINLLEFIAAITGIIFYKKFKYSSYKYFIWFLVYLSICDFIGGYAKYVNNNGFFSFLKGTVFEQNYWWSTLFWKIGAIMFFAFFYYKILITQRFKTIVKYSGYSFLVFSIAYILIRWDVFFVMFFPIIGVLGALVIFLCTVFYFIETLQSDKILTFYKSLNFYISVGIFVWWLIITPIVFYDNYTSNLDWNFIFLRWQIYLFANIIMYSTFTFALIFCTPEKEIS